MLAVEDRPADAEVLTYAAPDSARDRWLQRTISSTGERLGALRDRVLDAAHLLRHSLVLDLKAGSGLLTWEALRRAPEGGVYALARSERDAEALRQLAARLPEPERPLVLQGELAGLPALLAAQGGTPQHFDAVVGHNVLLDVADKPAAVTLICRLRAASGVISLAERLPRHTQRLYRLVDLTELDDDLAARVQAAEEAIYTQPDDRLVNWGEEGLAQWWAEAGCPAEIESEVEHTEVRITEGLLARWFAPLGEERPSYAQHLAAELNVEEVEQVRALFQRQLLNQTVHWESRVAYVVAKDNIRQ
jgi:putative ATPase